MPITDLATNVILNNVGSVYFLKTGVYRDSVGLDNNHPLSSVSALLIHIEDGVPQNIMLANYAPSKLASWASHDFPLWYRGQVEYTIAGESAPRTFAQYFTYVPSILVAMNKNGASVMDVNVTITQNTGANLLGGFIDLATLTGEYAPTEELSDSGATAYVYDSATKGFYNVTWNGVSAWVWTLIDQALVTYGVQTKQYNVLPIKVQRGYAPNQTPLSVSDEVIRLIYQEIAYVNALLVSHTDLIADLDLDIVNHLADLTNPHEVTALQTAYSNIVSLLSATTVQGAIDEIVGRLDTAEGDIDDLETFQNTTVPATYETIVNVNAHVIRVDNPHTVTKAQVGLGSVDNTADSAKPVSTPQAEALALKIDKTSNPVKSVTINTTTYVVTVVNYDDTTVEYNLPAELAFVSASYDNATKDITFVLQNGTSIAVPLDDIITGLATEVWVANNYYSKTLLDAGQLDNRYYTESEADAKFDLKLDKDISTLELYNIVDTDLFFKRSADGTLQRVTAQQAKDYFVSSGETFDATVNYMTNGLGAYKSAMIMAHPVTLQTNGDFRCTIKTQETNTLLYVIFPTITATSTLRVSTNNGTTYYNVLKNGSTMRASTVSGLLVRLQFDGTNFIADIQGSTAILESYSNKLNSTFGLFAPENNGVPLVKEISGRTIPALSNLVTNSGDVFTVTTGWDNDNSSVLDVNEGHLRITGNGGSRYLFIYQSGVNTIGNIAFYKTRIKLSAQASWVSIYDGNTSTTRIENPPVNTWIEISNRLTVIGEAVYILADYLDSTSQNTSVMEVDYVMSFDGTATFGTGLEPTASQMDAIVQALGTSGYISTTAVTHVTNSQFKTRGTQLFNVAEWVASYAYKITVKASTAYTWSTSIAYKLYDYLNNELASGTASTVTTTASTRYIAFNAITTPATFMLNEGATLLTWVAYNSETQKFNHDRLSQLPNLVADKIRYDNGAYVLDRYVAERTTISGDYTHLDTGYTNVDVVRLDKPSDFIYDGVAQNVVGTYNTQYYEGYINNYTGSDYDNASNVGNLYTNYYPNAWGIVVAKGTYADLAAAQSALAGTKIWYQLATPLLATEVIDVDGTLIQETVTSFEQLQTLPTTVNIEFSMNTDQTAKTLVQRDKMQQEEIDSIEGNVVTLTARKTSTNDIIIMSETAWATYTQVTGEVYGVYDEATFVITFYYGQTA